MTMMKTMQMAMRMKRCWKRADTLTAHRDGNYRLCRARLGKNPHRNQ
jgi:hypothetical protein